MAGEEQDLTLSSNYRSQWGSIVSAYQTSQTSLVYPIYSKDIEERHLGGFGATLFSDKTGGGSLNSLGINLSFAYNLPLTVDRLHNLSFGAQAGFMQRRIDASSFQWGSQYDPLNGYDATWAPDNGNYNDKTIYPDFSAGVIYYYNMYNQLGQLPIRAYFGASAFHLNKPNQSFYEGDFSSLPRNLKVHGLFEYTFDKLKVAPAGLFLWQQDVYMAEFGVSVAYRMVEYPRMLLDDIDLRLGLWMRARDAAIISLTFENPSYALGFSYDYNYSTLRTATLGKGAFEISLVLRWLKQHAFKKVYNPRA